MVNGGKRQIWGWIDEFEKSNYQIKWSVLYATLKMVFQPVVAKCP